MYSEAVLLPCRRKQYYKIVKIPDLFRVIASEIEDGSLYVKHIENSDGNAFVIFEREE